MDKYGVVLALQSNDVEEVEKGIFFYFYKVHLWCLTKQWKYAYFLKRGMCLQAFLSLHVNGSKWNKDAKCSILFHHCHVYWKWIKSECMFVESGTFWDPYRIIQQGTLSTWIKFCTRGRMVGQQGSASGAPRCNCPASPSVRGFRVSYWPTRFPSIACRLLLQLPRDLVVSLTYLARLVIVANRVLAINSSSHLYLHLIVLVFPSLWVCWLAKRVCELWQWATCNPNLGPPSWISLPNSVECSTTRSVGRRPEVG